MKTPKRFLIYNDTTQTGVPIIEGKATVIKGDDDSGYYQVRFDNEPDRTFDRFCLPENELVEIPVGIITPMQARINRELEEDSNS